MRSTTALLIPIAGWLACGTAAAQTDAVPARLSLAEAVRVAEQRNPALDAARQQVLVADADTAAAKRWPNPLASVESAGYSGKSTPYGFWDRQELTIQVEQEFELGDRRRLRGEAAGAAATATRASLDNRVRQIRIEVQRVYFQLVLARLDAEQARASLAEIDQVIAVSRSRYKQGEVSGGELRRLEVERLKFVDDVFAADLALRNARSQLLALVHAGRLDIVFEPVEPLAPPSLAPAGAAGATGAAPAPFDAGSLTAQALANRPDLLAARRAQDRADSEAKLQRAMRTPNVTLGAGYRRDFGDNGLVVALSVPLPVFGRNPGGVARAEAERQLASSRIAVAESAIALEVQEAVNNLEISRARVEYLERDFLKSARESRDIVFAAYREGAADLSDYLDAQRALRAGQRAYNRALFEHRMHLFRLDAALGRVAGDSRP